MTYSEFLIKINFKLTVLYFKFWCFEFTHFYDIYCTLSALLINNKHKSSRMVQFECEELTFFSQSSCKISHNSHTQFLECFTHFSQIFSSKVVVSVIYLKNTCAQILYCIILHEFRYNSELKYEKII
jgi:hypothetical protein